MVDECKWYFKSGGLSSLEKYDGSGALLNIEQWNEDGTYYTGENLITKGPIFDKENVSNRLSEKIRNNFNKKLMLMFNIDSNLIVSCYVNEDGNISSIDIKFHGEAIEAYDKEISRILIKYPFVGISYYHNQPQYAIINVPIRFVSNK